MKNYFNSIVSFLLLTAPLGVFAMDPEFRAFSEALESPVARRLRSASQPQFNRELFAQPETSISAGKQEKEEQENLFEAIPAAEESAASLVFGSRRNRAIDLIDAESVGGFVKIVSPFLSDPGIIKALIEAAQRGVEVEVLVGAKAKGLERLQDAKIPVTIIKNVHAKMIITSLGGLIGSDNFSQMSAARPQELLVQFDDIASREKASELFRGIPSFKSPGKTPRKSTPRKRKLVRAHTGYKAARFDRLMCEPDAANKLDIFSMTFDSERIVAKIEEIYNTCSYENRPYVRLFLDHSALKHPKLLKRMQKSGGDRLEIYIFNADKSQKVFTKFPQIMHQKAMIRTMHAGSAQEEKHVIISTGNLTDRSHREINFDFHYPDDSVLHDELKAFADEYAASPEWTKYQLPH